MGVHPVRVFCEMLALGHIIALARKLVVALRRYLTTGPIPGDALLKG
jgi:hypothetical protein